MFLFLIAEVVPSLAQDDNPGSDEMLFAVLDTANESLKKMIDMLERCEYKPEAKRRRCHTNLKKRLNSYIVLTIDLINLTQKKYMYALSNTKQDGPQFTDNRLPMDCQSVYERGQRQSGIYTIQLRLPEAENKTLDVYCDMDTDGGGWTVIQRRGNFTYQLPFRRYWLQYKIGFGNITRDFWIGNDIIYLLTNQADYMVRFDLEDRYADKRYALYDSFRIENEERQYTLSIGDYSGNAGDSMQFLDGMKFSSVDRKNDMRPAGEEGCAVHSNSAWWFNDCSLCNPNGYYMMADFASPGLIFWFDWKGYECLAGTEIKIRRSS